MIVESSMHGFVATVREDGTPNLSPKGSVRVYDDEHLVFVDTASPQTVRNIETNPNVEVNCVDFLRRRGYLFKGTAEIREPGDPVYEWIREWLLETHGPKVPAHHAVLIEVREVRPLLSPAYLFLDASEPELVRGWVETYGIEAHVASAGV
ncbi:MAG: pyridoxamine 5'-phosphate oxidase family protein [Solirubrobacterales bacterium]|nr:pyridoxamine 5'-phosphate oxidase family protein [Solirubrobacterales bacterium]